MSDLPEIQSLKKWWQKLAAHTLVAVLSLYWRTLRIKPSAETKEITKTTSHSTIFALWHNNLFVAFPLIRLLQAKTPIFALVSPSKDGAWLSYCFNLLKINTIRGSSKRQGLSAVSQMKASLSNGALIAMTPDGPRGPVYKCKNGLALLAQDSAATSVILVAVKFGARLQLPTWDKFQIPLPFSRVYVDARSLDYSDFKDLDTKAATALFEKSLNSLQQKLVRKIEARTENSS